MTSDQITVLQSKQIFFFSA